MSYDSTIELVSLALDAALMRQTAIATNIANANTQGYQTVEVNFEEQLDGRSHFTDNDIASIAHPVYQQSDTHSSIDEQIAFSVKNATQFRALIKGLNHKLAIMKMAVQGNNQS